MVLFRTPTDTVRTGELILHTVPFALTLEMFFLESRRGTIRTILCVDALAIEHSAFGLNAMWYKTSYNVRLQKPATLLCTGIAHPVLSIASIQSPRGMNWSEWGKDKKNHTTEATWVLENMLDFLLFLLIKTHRCKHAANWRMMRFFHPGQWMPTCHTNHSLAQQSAR